MPAGFARAAIQLYAQDPSLLSKENIDRWAATPPPVRETVPGEAHVMSPEEVAIFEEKVAAFESTKHAEFVPASDNISE